MPFGEFKDFDDCVKHNQDKESPEGYCSEIHKRTTGKYPSEEKGVVRKMKFNKPLNILTEKFEFKEQAGEEGEDKKIMLRGLALTLGKPTRNGVVYTLRDDSILNSMIGKPFLDTHNDDSALNTFGKVEKFWREGNNLMYEVEVDEGEKDFIRKAKKGYIPGTSVQVLCDTAEEQSDGNIHANIESFLELSAVTIPGEGDSTATLLEAFGKNPKRIIKIGKEGKFMKENDEGEGGQTPEVNPRPDLQEQAEDATPGFSMTRCIKKMAKHMDEPGLFCKWAFDKGITKYGEGFGDEDDFLDNVYTDYESFIKNGHRKEDLNTGNGGALIADEAPLEKEKEERIYDPAKKKMIKPNYEGEEELQGALDDIQDSGSKATPEDKRNMIPGAKKTQKEIFNRLSKMNNRVKAIEIKNRIEKINKKLEELNNGKKD